MTTYRKFFSLAIVAATLGTSATWAQDCKPAHQFNTVAPGKLTVAIYEYPPFTTISPDGTIGGVDGEIAKKFAAENCLTIVPAVVDPAATVQYVLSSKADVATGDWYRTAERAKVMGLSYPTYLDQMGLYSKAGLTTVDSLIGKKVGTVSGFLWVAEPQDVLTLASTATEPVYMLRRRVDIRGSRSRWLSRISAFRRRLKQLKPT
jgi:polar amino acid transport system substrate-binding protein